MRTVCFCLFIAISVHFFPVYGAKLTLEECQMIALSHGESKTIADLQALIAYDRIEEARSIGRPRLNAEADIMTGGDASRWHHHKINKHARVSLIIPLAQSQELILSQQRAYDAALYSAEQAEQEMLYAVTEAYFELLLAQKLEWILQESIRFLTSQLRVTHDLLSQGLLQRNEALIVEVELAQLEQDLVEAHFRTELSIARLNRLLGFELTNCIEIDDVLPEYSVEEDLATYIEAAKQQHPTLLALQAQIEATQHAYCAEKVNQYPQIYAFSNYSTTSEYALPYRQGFDAGVGVNYSIYDGGNSCAKMRRLKKEQCELEWRYKQLENDIELKVRTAFLGIQNASSKIPVAFKGVDLAEKNLLLTKSLFEEGLVANVDVITDDERLLQARLNYYRAIYAFHQSKANLIYSAGIYKKGCE